jgi:hypothetical protein
MSSAALSLVVRGWLTLERCDRPWFTRARSQVHLQRHVAVRSRWRCMKEQALDAGKADPSKRKLDMKTATKP